jgi:peptidoglycan/xylan/chitin deacetylase (PgdA/CDA1 family)
MALAAACAAGLAVAQAGPGITGLRPVRRALFPGLAGQGDPRHVALTFDDGPDPEATPQFAGLLAARGVHGTFFLLGEMAVRAPGLVTELAAAGHEVGVHGWQHRYLPLRGPRATYDDIARTADLLADRTGRWPRLYRPPYGVLSGAALAAVRRLGLTPVLWGAWGREWTPGATPSSVQACLRAHLRGGVTVLLHDSDCTSPGGSWRAALGALPLLLDECEDRGLAVGPFGQHGGSGCRGAAGQQGRDSGGQDSGGRDSGSRDSGSGDSGSGDTGGRGTDALGTGQHGPPGAG